MVKLTSQACRPVKEMRSWFLRFPWWTFWRHFFDRCVQFHHHKFQHDTQITRWRCSVWYPNDFHRHATPKNSWNTKGGSQVGCVIFWVKKLIETFGFCLTPPQLVAKFYIGKYKVNSDQNLIGEKTRQSVRGGKIHDWRRVEWGRGKYWGKKYLTKNR